MKCTCGYERTPGSILCRMLEVVHEKFVVRVYDLNNRLFAQSASCLSVDKAVDFVKQVINVENHSQPIACPKNFNSPLPSLKRNPSSFAP
jgi:hypothetical protein